jgi:hypothetical protein
MATLTVKGDPKKGYEIVGKDIPATAAFSGGDKTWGGYKVLKRALSDAASLASQHGATIKVEAT